MPCIDKQKPINYNLLNLWSSSALLQTEFITSAYILCTNFNVFCNVSIFYVCFIGFQQLPISVDDQDRNVLWS